MRKHLLVALLCLLGLLDPNSCHGADCHVVTPLAGPNGAITPASPRMVDHGGSIGFYVTPRADYTVDAWRVDGKVVEQWAWAYRLSNVTSNCTVSVTFAPLVTITPVAGAHGSISPQRPCKLKQGAVLAYTATPAPGYRVDAWSVDAVVVQQGGSRFLLRDTQGNRTVAVSFAPVRHTVTPIAGPNGTITPGTPRLVEHGGSVSFNVTPRAGYTLDAWRVDGKVVEQWAWSYRLVNVTSNCTVSVTFAPLSTVTPVAHEHGGITPGVPFRLKSGAWQTLAATPDPGFTVQHWAVDGEIVQRFGLKYTLRAVSAQHRVEVAFIRLTREPPPEGATVFIAPYAGDKLAAVSYTFDDGTVSQSRYAVPALNSLGLTATFFVVPNFLDARPLAAPGGWTDWWRAADAGHEIGNHSKSHVDLTACTDAALAAQILGASARIATMLGVDPISFACPLNSITDRVRDAVLQSHVALREIWVPMDGMSVEQANAVVDSAILEGRWMVPVLHDIETKPDGQPAMPLTTLMAHLQHVKSWEHDVWVAPFGTVARYLRDSLAASLDVLEDDGVSLRFLLTSPLEPEPDPIPLTVVLLPPSPERTSVRVTYDGESALLPVTYTSYGALVELVPSSDEIIATWE